MAEVWNKYTCPKCKSSNWVYMYDPDDHDCSKIDPSVITKCWNCSEKFIDSDDQEMLCDAQDTWLWDEVEHNVEKFIEKCDDYEDGLKESK